MVDMAELETLMRRNKMVMRTAYCLIFLIFFNILIIWCFPWQGYVVTSVFLLIASISTFITAKRINTRIKQIYKEQSEQQKKKTGEYSAF